MLDTLAPVSHEHLLNQAISRVDAAVRAQDVAALGEAYSALRERVVAASDEERAAAVGGLAGALAEIPVFYGSGLAAMAGGMVGMHGDPIPVLDVLVERACGVLEDATVFVRCHREWFGPLPNREETSYDDVAERFEKAAGDRLEAPRRRVAAWRVGEDWVQPVLFLCQRADVRRALPQRDRLRSAAEGLLQEFADITPWLLGLLRVLDDERLVVLHRATGRGFWVTITGVADNFQLHTLLAARLLAPPKRGVFVRSKGMLPGDGPTAAMVAAADGTGDPQPAGGITGQFNLVDAHGQWIWNEGRPDEIPVIAGHRVIVLDPSPYQRSWNAGRAYPLMAADVVLEPMTAGETYDWISRVKPATTNPAQTPPSDDGTVTWTDDMRITLPSGRTVADVVDLVLARVLDAASADEVEAVLAAEFELAPEDAALARDRAMGGVVRAGTGNDHNRPDPVKDPIAHESYQRAVADPSLPAQYFPDLFAR